MKLSKNVLYLGIISYSIAVLLLQDWGLMQATVGVVSALWLGKMVLDVVFAGMGFLRFAGDTLFADEEADDEVAIHKEDLAFSDTALFGFFMLNVFANAAFHGYATIQNTGSASVYFSIWFMAEVVVLFLSFILFKQARKAQLRAARKAREGINARSTIRSAA